MVATLDWLPGSRSALEFLSGWCILDLTNSEQIGSYNWYIFQYKRGKFLLFLFLVKIQRVSSCKELLCSISCNPLHTSHGTSPHHGMFWTGKVIVLSGSSWLLSTCEPTRWGERRSRRKVISLPGLCQHYFPVTASSRRGPASTQRHSSCDETGPRIH